MGLFGHKKRVYVVWGRFDDAKDISGGEAVKRGLQPKDIAFVIKKFSGETYKPADIRVVEDAVMTGYTKPMNQVTAQIAVQDAWQIVTKRFKKELFDKSKDVETHMGICDFSVMGTDDYGLFLVYIYA